MDKKYFSIEELTRFYRQKDANSNKIAIVDKLGKRKTTYADFIKLTNSIAYYLKCKNINKGDIVVLEMGRTAEHYAAKFACFFLGFVSFSLNLDIPCARKQMMLNQTNPKYTLTQDEISKIKIDDYPCQIDRSISDDELSFIVYTSGTTGKPKGIVHDRSIWESSKLLWDEYCGAVVNNILLSGDTNINIISSADMMFIMFFFDFMFLSRGGTVHLTTPDILINLPSLIKYISENHVNAITCIPNVLKNILSNKYIKLAFIAGEKCDYDFSESNINIFNIYGASECALIALGDGKKGNILNKTLSAGKLCFSKDKSNRIEYTGPSVMVKYVDSKNADNIITYNENSSYRTLHSFDIAKPLGNNSFKIIGRSDSVVKLSGKRICLDEIESFMVDIEGINEAAVNVHHDGSRQYLCGYYVSNNNEAIKVETIINSLKQFLPEYMIPRYFQLMKSLPRSSRGKIDRSKLPKPILDNSNKEYIPPKTELEKNLCEIISNVLNIKVGMNDDFFDLGGSSVEVMEILSKLNINNFNANYFYEGRTIKNIIKKFLEENTESKTDLEKEIIGRENLYQLPYTVNELYKAYKAIGEIAGLHFSFALKFTELIDLEKFRDALNKFTSSSSTFKVVIIEKDGVPYFKYAPNLYRPVEIENMTDLEYENFLQELEPEHNLDNLLYKFRIIKTETSNYFFFDFHHFITDAYGVSLFLTDVFNVYFGKEVADNYFFAWLYDENNHNILKKNKKIIEKQKNIYESQNWDQNVIDTDNKNTEHKILKTVYNPHIKLDALNKFLKRKRISRSVFLSAAMILAESKMMKQKNIIFTVLHSGRFGESNHAGCRYSATLMFVDFSNCQSFNDFLAKVKTEYDDAIENRNCSYYKANLAGINGFRLNDLKDILNKQSKLKKYFDLINLNDYYENNCDTVLQHKFLYFNDIGDDLMSWIFCDQTAVSKEKQDEFVYLTFDIMNRIIDEDDNYLNHLIAACNEGC